MQKSNASWLTVIEIKSHTIFDFIEENEENLVALHQVRTQCKTYKYMKRTANKMWPVSQYYFVDKNTIVS